MKLRAQVAGCGAYLPERVLTNDELASRLDTSDDWIRQRTGIGERRIAAEGELTSDLAVTPAGRAPRRGGRARLGPPGYRRAAGAAASRDERQRPRPDRAGDGDPRSSLPGDR